MSDYTCAYCGMKIRFIKIKIKDGYICGPCSNRLPLNDFQRKEELTSEEIVDIINKGIERDNSKPDMLQSALKTFNDSKANKKSDKFDEVRKYKELYDEGLITEEEYEAKRKEILEL